MLLDRSETMLLKDRWTLLHRTLHHFIAAVPEGSEVSVVTFNDAAVMNLSPTVITEWNRFDGENGRSSVTYLSKLRFIGS